MSHGRGEGLKSVTYYLNCLLCLLSIPEHLFSLTKKILGTCMLNNAAYIGTILTSIFINASASHCQLECLMKFGCVQFNFNSTSGQCLLLSSLGTIQNIVSITGPKVCGDYSLASPSSKFLSFSIMVTYSQTKYQMSHQPKIMITKT